jgi:hypothetical protein
VKSIQFFQYIGVVIESNIEERWKEIGGKKWRKYFYCYSF